MGGIPPLKLLTLFSLFTLLRSGGNGNQKPPLTPWKEFFSHLVRGKVLFLLCDPPFYPESLRDGFVQDPWLSS